MGWMVCGHCCGCSGSEWMYNSSSTDTAGGKGGYVALYRTSDEEHGDVLSAIFPVDAAGTLYAGLKAYVKPEGPLQSNSVLRSEMRSAATNVRLINVNMLMVCSRDLQALAPLVEGLPRFYDDRQDNDVVVGSNVSEFQSKRFERRSHLRKAFFGDEQGPLSSASGVRDAIVATGRSLLIERVEDLLVSSSGESDCLLGEGFSGVVRLFQSMLDECLIIDEFDRAIQDFSDVLRLNRSLAAGAPR